MLPLIGLGLGLVVFYWGALTMRDYWRARRGTDAPQNLLEVLWALPGYLRDRAKAELAPAVESAPAPGAASPAGTPPAPLTESGAGQPPEGDAASPAGGDSAPETPPLLGFRHSLIANNLRAWFFGALALLLVGQYALSTTRAEQPVLGWVLLLAGGLGLAWAARPSAETNPGGLWRGAFPPGNLLGLARWAMVGGLALALVLSQLREQNYQIYFAVIWLVSVGLLGILTWLWDQRSGVSLSPNLARADAVWLTGLTLAGLLVALYRLQSLPNSLMGDEGSFWTTARDIASRAYNPPLFEVGVYGFPVLGSMYQAQILRWFGATVWAWRFSSALAGVATVGPLYLLARELFERRVAVVAAVLLLASPFFLAFARLGYTSILALFPATLALYWAYLGLKRSSAFYLFMAGGAAGLGFYTAPAGRGAVLVLALFFLLRWLTDIRHVGQWLTSAVLSAGGWFMVAAPYFFYLAAKDPSLPLGLLAPEGFAAAGYARGLAVTLLALHNPSLITQHFLAAPLAGTWGAPVYFVGLCLSLLGWRERRHQYLLLWFGASVVLFSAASESPPHDRNLVGLIPLLALWGGVGLVTLFDIACKLARPLAARATAWALVGLTLVIAGSGLSDYFQRVPQIYRPDFENIIGWAGLLAPDYRLVYVYGDPAQQGFQPYVLREFLPHQVYETVSLDALIQHQINLPADQPTLVFYPLEIDNAAIAASSTYWPLVGEPTVFRNREGAGIGGLVTNVAVAPAASLSSDSYPRPIWIWFALLLALLATIYFFRRDWLAHWPAWAQGLLTGVTAPPVDLSVNESLPAPGAPTHPAPFPDPAETWPPVVSHPTIVVSASMTTGEANAPRVAQVQVTLAIPVGTRVELTIEAPPDADVPIVRHTAYALADAHVPAPPPSLRALPPQPPISAPPVSPVLLTEAQAVWRDSLAQIRGAWAERRWQVLALVASPGLAYLAGRMAGDKEQAVSPMLSILFWLGAIGLAVYGSWRGTPRGWRLPREAWLWVGGVTVIALVVRGWDLRHIPVVLTGDEGSSGLSAMRFVNGQANNLFAIGWYSFPSLFFFIQSLPLRLLGPTITGVRLSSAIAGTLTVGGLYLLGRVMYGQRVGLVAAVLLAGLHFHLHFSRIGLNNIWDGLSYVFVLGAFWHGWKNETRGSFVLAGVGLGLAQYFYPSSRSLVVVLVAWLVVAVLDWPRLRRNLPSVGLMFGVGGVVFLPLALFFLKHPDEYMAPIQRVTILGRWLTNEVQNTGQPAWQILWQQFKLSVEAYTQTPLRVWYMPGTPLLRLPSAVFFWVGLLLLVWRYRDGRTWLLGLWLLAVALGGALTESTPAAQRYVAAAPVAVLVAAYALVVVAEWLFQFQPRYVPYVGVAVVVAAVGISLADMQFYFQDYTPRTVTDGSFGGDNTWVAHKLGFYLQDKPSDTQVFFFGAPRMGYFSIPSVSFLAPQVTGFEMLHPWGAPDNPQPASAHLIFVFLPGFDNDRTLVEANYPGGRWVQENMPDGRLLYWLYEYAAPAGAPPPVSLPTPTPFPPGYPMTIEPTMTFNAYPVSTATP